MFGIGVVDGFPFRAALEGAFDAAGTLTLETAPVKSNGIQDVQAVCIVPLDGDATVTTIYAGRAGVERPIVVYPTVKATDSRVYTGLTYLTEGERIRVSIAGGTDTQRVAVTVYGVERTYAGEAVPLVKSA